jgi:site-specific recombinase XerD
LSRLFHETADAAGIKKNVTLHALRHSSGNRIIPATDVKQVYFLGDHAIIGACLAE